MNENKSIELDDINSWSHISEEFLSKIYRVSELTYNSHPDDAKRLVENIFSSKDDEVFGQSILAIVYFKLGIYQRVLVTYKHMIEKQPENATFRLNLGLVYLKTGQTEKAAKALEIAVALLPNYRKAHGYLGLAYSRLGKHHKSEESFNKAGAKHLAAKMERFVETDSAKANEKNLSQAFFFDEVSNSIEPMSVSEFTEKSSLPSPLAGNFLINEAGFLLIDIESKGFSRLEDLHFLSAEKLSYKPVKRKYRGSDCDEIFGLMSNPLFEITGSGRLGFHPKDMVFNAISLDGDVIYIREEFVFAMEPSLGYENGRIPNDDSILVHLNGRGTFVLKTPSKVRSIEVKPDKGVIIPKKDLVGWFGRMLPKPLEKSPFSPTLGALEMSGEGVLLVCFS